MSWPAMLDTADNNLMQGHELQEYCKQSSEVRGTFCTFRDVRSPSTPGVKTTILGRGATSIDARWDAISGQAD